MSGAIRRTPEMHADVHEIIAADWYAAFRMQCSTSMLRTLSPSTASFIPLAIPRNGASVSLEWVQSAAEPGIAAEGGDRAALRLSGPVRGSGVALPRR